VTGAVVYSGTARHTRSGPSARVFSPRLFLAYLDVDALPGALDGLPGWSARRRAPVHFRAEDFLTGDRGSLGDGVRALVRERLGRRPDGPVYLLAQLRTWGYVFNPLSVYYCWDRDGRALDAVVLEVTNTPWRERTWYVFDARTAPGAGRTTRKDMYVSPFLPMDVDYHVSWTAPGDDLRLDVRVERDRAPIFTAGLRMRRRPLTRRSAVELLVRYPMLPLRSVAAIYRHAIRLWWQRFPIVRHGKDPGPEVP
jgi:DUF1365 family protein